MECERLANCSFYQNKMPIESGLGSLYRKKYCEGDKTRCARYLVVTKLGPEYVPDDLYPNMDKRAEEILAKNSTK